MMAYDPAYYQAHKAARMAAQARWRAKNPGVSATYARKARAANPERARAVSKAWRDANREKERARQRASKARLRAIAAKIASSGLK